MYSLETERLILRPFRETDVDFLNYLHSDLDVLQYTLGRTRSYNENVAYIITMLELHDQGIGHLLVINKSDLKPVGRCGFSHFFGVHEGGMDHFYWGSPDNVTKDGDIFKLVELGYTYSMPAWGNGYATEAAIAMRDYGFKELGYDEISSLVLKENTPSINVAKKLGAQNIVECMTHDHPSYNLRNVKNG